jgi:hypothetical protein
MRKLGELPSECAIDLQLPVKLWDLEKVEDCPRRSRRGATFQVRLSSFREPRVQVVVTSWGK